MFAGQDTPFVTEANYLGLTFGQKLPWNPDIQQTAIRQPRLWVHLEDVLKNWGVKPQENPRGNNLFVIWVAGMEGKISAAKLKNAAK